jgi:hypothetical protein
MGCVTGCKNCANTAPDTFAIEEEFGRARVVSQLGDPTLAQSAIETWFCASPYATILLVLELLLLEGRNHV